MSLLIDNRQEKNIEEKLLKIIESAVEECLEYEGLDPNYEVSLSLVGNGEIKELNRTYREKDSVTDVLSFPLFTDVETEELLLGDIVIAVPRAMEQAEEYNHSFHREMGFLVVHSMFHLMGYDHDTEPNTAEMRQREEDVLQRIGLIRD